MRTRLRVLFVPADDVNLGDIRKSLLNQEFDLLLPSECSEFMSHVASADLVIVDVSKPNEISSGILQRAIMYHRPFLTVYNKWSGGVIYSSIDDLSRQVLEKVREM